MQTLQSAMVPFNTSQSSVMDGIGISRTHPQAILLNESPRVEIYPVVGPRGMTQMVPEEIYNSACRGRRKLESVLPL